MNVKFYLFGDSICFGQLVSHHLTWISSLSSRLSRVVGLSALIQNASINGNTTRQALERMSYDVASHRPDVLLIQFGMNDCNYWQTDFGVPRVSLRSFESNLIEIIERAEMVGVKHIFIATNHPSTKGKFIHMNGLTHSESNEKYNSIIRMLAKSLINANKNITLIDNEKFWLDLIESKPEILLEDLLLPDGIHLSESGHRLYNEYAVKIICEYFEEQFR
jgi:lysophospholipase L1-like esterase